MKTYDTIIKDLHSGIYHNNAKKINNDMFITPNNEEHLIAFREF